MHAACHIALLGSASILLACASTSGLSTPEDDAGSQPAPLTHDVAAGVDAAMGKRATARVDAAVDAKAPSLDAVATNADAADAGTNGDAGTDGDAGTNDIGTPLPPAEYTLTITSPAPNAPVSGTINIVGLGPGFLNLEVHSTAGALLSRVVPDATGNFSAPVETAEIGVGAVSVTIDGWDAPAGSPFMHHATTSLPLTVGTSTSDGGSPTGVDGGGNSACINASGDGIRYFGAYTKNTQTNYDFNSWSGFQQNFLTSFIDCDTWANMAASDWGFQIMSLQPTGENIQEIVCLSTTQDASLKDTASGMWDSYLQQIGNLFLTYNYPNAVIRLGHEFAGNWYPWGLSGGVNNMDYTDFIAAFRHVAGILKAISPTFTIVWNPGCGYWDAGMNSELAYPGDDVVDVVGVDCYDDGSGVSHLIDGDYGMNQWGAFAQQHGKPVALPEWGLAAGDDPAYIQAMYTFMTSNDTFLEGFWDSDDGSTTSQLSTGEAPNSGTMFLQTFGQYAKGCE